MKPELTWKLLSETPGHCPVPKELVSSFDEDIYWPCNPKILGLPEKFRVVIINIYDSQVLVMASGSFYYLVSGLDTSGMKEEFQKLAKENANAEMQRELLRKRRDLARAACEEHKLHERLAAHLMDELIKLGYGTAGLKASISIQLIVSHEPL